MILSSQHRRQLLQSIALIECGSLHAVYAKLPDRHLVERLPLPPFEVVARPGVAEIGVPHRSGGEGEAVTGDLAVMEFNVAVEVVVGEVAAIVLQDAIVSPTEAIVEQHKTTRDADHAVASIDDHGVALAELYDEGSHSPHIPFQTMSEPLRLCN